MVEVNHFSLYPSTALKKEYELVNKQIKICEERLQMLKKNKKQIIEELQKRKISI